LFSLLPECNLVIATKFGNFKTVSAILLFTFVYEVFNPEVNGVHTNILGYESFGYVWYVWLLCMEEEKCNTLRRAPACSTRYFDKHDTQIISTPLGLHDFKEGVQVRS
jgi:hypothetical protein